MKPFKSLVIVKHPPDLVWTAMRDRLPEIAPMLDDVASIRVAERQDMNGLVRLVNEWRIQPRIPASLASVITPDMLGWLDRAEWQHDGLQCRWSIEPFFLPEAVECIGATSFEPAIGGRGTRVTFAGSLAIDKTRLAGFPASLGFPVTAAVEALVTTLIPKNFRKTADALAALLDESA